MLTTRFLAYEEYAKYGDWMKCQDPDTLNMYFGFAVNHEYIDRLLENIIKHKDQHNFLVAEYCDVIVGVIHIAVSPMDVVEFGVSVAKDRRQQGIADRLMSEAILWVRNRGYQTLYMHCLTWNTPIKKLCAKHGLNIKSAYGESETKITLPPRDLVSIGAEIAVQQKNIYRMILQNNLKLIQDICN